MARLITGRNVFLNMEKGDKIHKSKQSYLQQAVGSGLMSHAAYAPAIQRQAEASKVNQNINVAYNGLTEKQLERALSKTLGKQPKNITSIDKSGFSTYTQSETGRINYLNDKVLL